MLLSHNFNRKNKEAIFLADRVYRVAFPHIGPDTKETTLRSVQGDECERLHKLPYEVVTRGGRPFDLRWTGYSERTASRTA
ncbi:MAG: hypothetical protein BMS9Abin28_0023 [Anaerolineae bacterium]|nr:MAG: hypothetical protein BMS9Abin28_0023 [Anaerolineae bacterium]